MSMIHDSTNDSDSTASSFVSPSLDLCDTATKSFTPLCTCDQAISCSSTPASVSEQPTNSSTLSCDNDLVNSSSSLLITSDQAISWCSTPLNFSDSATICNSTPPNVSDQAISNSTLSSNSDQVTSSIIPPSVSEQAANCFGQTSKISSFQHAESHEMIENVQIVAADEHPDYLQVIDQSANYLHIIDDNVGTVNYEPGFNTLDDVESQSEFNFQRQSYYSFIEDGNANQGITSDEARYLPIVDSGSDYDHSLSTDRSQAQHSNEPE